MIDIRAFNEAGLAEFKSWLADANPGAAPSHLLTDDALSQAVNPAFQVDDAGRFPSRYEFGVYLADVFKSASAEQLLLPQFDGMWAWINALYFSQLAPGKARRTEHYIPVRRGSAGSLLHRNAARTAFELVSTHGSNAQFALQQRMDVHGQLLESLTASQGVARNRGFFAAAARMYTDWQGKIRKGAATKPKHPRDRKPGDTAGKGSIRRLPLALKRLELTYDVEMMSADQLVALLPREFSRWAGPDAGKPVAGTDGLAEPAVLA